MANATLNLFTERINEAFMNIGIAMVYVPIYNKINDSIYSYMKPDFVTGGARASLINAGGKTKAGSTGTTENNPQNANETSYAQSSENSPSSSTKVSTLPESKAPNTMKYSDATNAWDDFLGQNTTSINPRTGTSDPNRIFSADGTRSIRFGSHEMNSIGSVKAHFHYETWSYDPFTDTMTISNVLQRLK